MGIDTYLGFATNSLPFAASSLANSDRLRPCHAQFAASCLVGSASPGRDELPIPLRVGHTGPVPGSDHLALVDVLRQALDEGTRSPESILKATADAARVLTGAHGTALALRADGVI